MTLLETHVQRLLDSFKKWTGRELIARTGDPAGDARALFDAPFVIVSHGTQADPILNYGNAAALILWEVDWGRLTAMPSRETAEPMHREEREQFMNKVRRDGFVSGYGGIRISSTGKRFRIEDAVIWNVLDEAGAVVGQAAMFERWRACS
ncbi:MAG TPA: MEKHLA domain-containing protein [Planctomycetota bacterium]|nr:MEKHLA domain-containing protein [Planctomycetota bacterium]